MIPSDQLAIIVPARAGSKRLKNKNRSIVGGISLLDRTFDLLQELNALKSTIFTTDDPILFEHAANRGIYCPELRPSQLCDDGASTISVIDYAVNILAQKLCTVPEYTLLLQLTSPFRYPSRISFAIETMLNCSEYGSLFSASFSESKTYKTLSDTLDISLVNGEFSDGHFIDANGNFYIAKTSDLLSGATMFPSKAAAIITSYEEAIDIDNKQDLNEAEKVAKKLNI